MWDVRRSSDDPLNGIVLARCDNDVSTFTLGDIYKGEATLIVSVPRPTYVGVALELTY